MANVVLAFVGEKAVDQRADSVPEFLAGSFFGQSELLLELGEDHFDWVEVGAVGRQEEERCAALLDEGGGVAAYDWRGCRG
jgi:hypothetical protein